MIRHVVFFSVRATQSREQVRDGLRLLGTIPHSTCFEVGENLKLDQIDNDVDFVVYAEFRSEADLHAFKAHPTYAEATRRVRPLRELRIAADFTSGGEDQAAGRT